jgi:hypothetical protein
MQLWKYCGFGLQILHFLTRVDIQWDIETDVNDDIAMFRMLTFATNHGKSQVLISPDIHLL